MNNLFTANWGDLPPPKKTKVAHIISSLKYRYMAWMEGDEWPLYMTFIDRMSDTAPNYLAGNPGFADSRLNFGHWLRSQGPTEAHNV